MKFWGNFKTACHQVPLNYRHVGVPLAKWTQEPHYCVIRTPVGITMVSGHNSGHPGHNIWAGMRSHLYFPFQVCPTLNLCSGRRQGRCYTHLPLHFTLGESTSLQIKAASRSLCSAAVGTVFPCEPFLWPGASQTAHSTQSAPQPTQSHPDQVLLLHPQWQGEWGSLWAPAWQYWSPLLAACPPHALVAKRKKGWDSK